MFLKIKTAYRDGLKMNFLINRELLDTRNMPQLPNVTYFQKVIPNQRGFLFGTISNMGADHPAKRIFYNLKVSDYIGPMYKYCLNAHNSYFKQVFQLNDLDIGKFIKSNSGCKIWTGDILTNDSLRFLQENLPVDEMMFLAPYKKIIEEYRFWIINDEIITSSSYSWDNKTNYTDPPEKVVAFVESWKDWWSPDWAYVVDVGVAVKPDNTYDGIIEYNCLSTSGLYNADIPKIIQALEDIL